VYLLLAYLMLVVAALCLAASKLLDATFAPVVALAGGLVVVVTVAAFGERRARGSRWRPKRPDRRWSAG